MPVRQREEVQTLLRRGTITNRSSLINKPGSRLALADSLGRDEERKAAATSDDLFAAELFDRGLVVAELLEDRLGMLA